MELTKTIHLRDLLTCSPAVASSYRVYEYKGTHGSGKSAVPKMLIQNEVPLYAVDNRGHVWATVLPRQQIVLLGSYRTDRVSGGCDGIRSLFHVEALLRRLWLTPYTLILEGILMTNARTRTLSTMAKAAMATGAYRPVLTTYLDAEEQTCIDRVMKRSNRTTPIKEHLLLKIHKYARRAIPFVREFGVSTVLHLDTENLDIAGVAKATLGAPILLPMDIGRVSDLHSEGRLEPKTISKNTLTDEELLCV